MAVPLNCSRLRSTKTSYVLKLSKRIASTRAPAQAIILEKTLEAPAIVLREEDHVDIIGPPDTLSNLRPIIRKILKTETNLQQKFRETADATQRWNQEFWSMHNTNFIKEKEIYVKRHTSADKPHLNADEMSDFYKDFLNKYWKIHVTYNYEWYVKNFTLLFLALRVNIERLQHKVL